MSFTYYSPKIEHTEPFDPRESVGSANYRLGDFLQCLLVSFGLFGQLALVIAAIGLHISSRTLTVPARAFIVSLALSAILALMFRPNRARLSWHLVAFLVFWGAYGARIALEASTRIDVVTETGRYTSEFIASMALGGCFLPGMAVLINSCWAWHRHTRIIAISLAIISAVAMLYFYGAHLTNFEHRMTAGKAVGEVIAIHPLALGYLGAALSLFAFHNFLYRRSNILGRVAIGIALAGVGVFLLVGSASRGPVIAVGVASLVLIASQARRFELGRLLTLGAVFCISVTSLFIVANKTGSSVFNRLLGTGDEITAEAEGDNRLGLYTAALSKFTESPLVGKSVTVREADGTDRYPHNIILESLLATGLLGTVPLLYLIGAGLMAGWRILTRFPELGWIPVLFILFLTGSMFSGAIFSNVELWLTMAATLSCDAWLRQNERMEAEYTA